jgi:hypothetical protein
MMIADREVTVWDLAASRELRRLLPPAEGQAAALAFGPHGTQLAAVGTLLYRRNHAEGGFIVVWDVRTGAERFVDTDLAVGVTAVAFSDDGRMLVTGSSDGGVRLWDIAAGQLRYRFTGHGGPPGVVASSPDGKFVASGGKDTPIFIWDVEGGYGKPAPADLFSGERGAGLWERLGDECAAAAFAAIRHLVVRPASAVALLRERLRPTPILPDKTARQLLNDLDADAFSVREKATAELQALGESAETCLRKALQEKPSAEAKRRIDHVLQSAGFTMAARLRTARAVEVLERIGTADARKLLEYLAGGAEGSLLTREARDAVERLKGR